MVGTLIGWALLERGRRMRGPMLVGWIVGGVAGLGMAAATWSINWLAVGEGPTGDLLAATVGAWGVCWVALPVLFGTRETPQLEHLALLPLSRRAIMTGLSVTTLLAPGPVLTALALGSVVVFAAPYGMLAFAVGVVAAVAQVLLFVLLGQVLVAVLGASLSSRAWRLAGQVAFAIVGSTSWLARIPLAGLGERLAAGTAPAEAKVLHLLPSGWAVSAVEAAATGDVVTCVAAVTALLAGCALLWAVWGAAVRRRLGRDSFRRGVSRAARRVAVAGSPVRAVLRRELLLWTRHDPRTLVLLLGTCSGLAIGPLMAMSGVEVMLAFGGLAAIFAAATFTANLYGFDGPGIWTTTVVPGSATPDVRGRAWAWLAVIGPIGLLLTLGPALAAPGSVCGVLPWIAAAMPAMLGCGAGAVVLISALAPYSLPSTQTGARLPFRVFAGPLQFVAMTALTLALALCVLPSLGVVLLGVVMGSPLLSWLGLPVGMGVGLVSVLVLSRSAAKVAERRAPEILRATFPQGG